MTCNQFSARCMYVTLNIMLIFEVKQGYKVTIYVGIPESDTIVFK